MTMIAVRFPTEIETRLDALAAATGRTKTFYVREAILEQLDDLEDYYLAAEVVERIRKGQERTLSLDEVEHQLGLEG